MRDLVVDLLQWREPLHATPEAAIAFAESQEEAYRSANQAAFVGAVVESVSFDEDVLEVLTAKGGVAVRIVDGQVAHELLDPVDKAPARAANADVVFCISMNDVRWVWNRPAIAGSIIGTRLMRVFGSSDFVWLYFSEIGIVAVNVLVNKDTAEPFLHWTFSD